MGTSTNCSAFCGRRRSTKRCGIGSREILGTAMTYLLDRRRVDLLQHFHLLVLHLRHRHIEDLHIGQVVDDVLHSVPQIPLLWPHLHERCRPGGKHVPIVVQRKVLCAYRVEVEESSGPWHSSSRLSPNPGTGCPLAPWGGMVRRFSQGHGDGHPLIPQVCTEASLSSPPCGSRDVVNTSHGVDH